MTKKKAVEPLFYARRGPFRYGPQASDAPWLDWGQVTQLKGLRNDKLLQDLGHFAQVGNGTELYQCDQCGAKFIGMSERQNHFLLRHRNMDRNPVMEDEHAELHAKMLDQVAPAFLEHSSASAKEG